MLAGHDMGTASGLTEGATFLEDFLPPRAIQVLYQSVYEENISLEIQLAQQ
jgi:hypothetical protein